MSKTLSIVVPAYNEQSTIYRLLEKVANVEFAFDVSTEILVIDDASTDATEEKIKTFQKSYGDCQLVYLKQSVNKGKGAAIREGIAKASGDFIIVQDADLEYDPREYNDLLRPFMEEVADVVYGSRFQGNNPHRILFFWHSIGNKFLTSLSNAFTNLNLTDMETCYKMFRADLIKSIDLKENRFGFEPEVTAKIARIPGIRIYEVGISYYGRTYDEGKKINWKDGLKAIYCIIRYNLFR
ncbi:glycosyltransferase family 2 protein [Marinilabilia rubra]|uniref:Glycosyl transferase n=1 Tax=Marinilabilia rubra TaxID=2162893 RepID=A0A2U2BCJ7_9BACT|nr:glycosyltransferase family 2 protein [Marinilabilia rubra]PWE00781.1 glycosyl transferase [Marinilabilia rubra]